MIIDAHVHLGEDVVFDEVNTEEELIKYYDEFDIDGEMCIRDSSMAIPGENRWLSLSLKQPRKQRRQDTLLILRFRMVMEP